MIPGGEKYERSAGKFEDGWSVWRCCIACAEISNEFSDDGRSFGVLWEELENSWDEGAHLQACLNRLSTATAKEHMRQRWMKWKGLDKVTPPDLPAKP